jgi:phosphoglycolate phosphatase
MKSRLLILLDIDGTLLRTRGMGLLSMRLAMQEVFGTPGTKLDYRPGGRNYLQIVRDLLAETDITEDQIKTSWPKYQEVVARQLEEQITAFPDRVYALPGGRELVAALSSRADITLGILTGNPEPLARLKLQAAGYCWSDFRLGAYGDEAPERAAQVELARQRAKDLTGDEFSGSKTIIIGDTVHDVRCANATGACSIVVTSGDDTWEELARENPDSLLGDLVGMENILRFLHLPIVR